MWRVVVLFLGWTRAAVGECPSEVVEYPPSGGSFGIGSEHGGGYEDGAVACWVLEVEGSAITVSFDFVHTEFQRDFVRVVRDDGEVEIELSGELTTPYVVRVETRKISVEFSADETYHSEPLTMQLGFRASYFDSSDGRCVNECNQKHGVCTNGLCDCEEEWGPDGTTDCSIATTKLTNDFTFQIQNLTIGAWAYFRFDVPHTETVLVELVDYGGVDADPRLMIARDTVPTLSHYRYNDWFNWYYDCSDIHYLRGDIGPGTYFVGVTNDRFRAKDDGLFANLTLRVGTTPGEYRCLLDCNGHGTCDTSTGDCACDEGWEGSEVNAPDTCQFEINQDLVLEGPLESSVRIGNWDYYAISVPSSSKSTLRTTLFVEFASLSPHSYPVVFARYGEVPRLWQGYLPTYDAFDADVGDRAGFELVQGQRQVLLLNSSVLRAGVWYVGVYNIWGHNGAEQYNSHDTCTYRIEANFFSAGTPCPSTANGFCDGFACDFNSGECACPSTRLWRDCSFVAETLIKNGATISRRALAVEDTEYFLVSLSRADLDAKKNVVVTVKVSSSSSSQTTTPVVLARFGDLPFPNDLSKYDDHDLLSTFYHDPTHQILLDAEELESAGPGDWYVAVNNPESSQSSLDFSISVLWAAEVPCPAKNNLTCSDAGACVASLGRCDCDDGFAMDDCSADGVFRLSRDNPSTNSGPPIAPDDWAFWSIVVGCEDRKVKVTFHTSNDGALPFLVMRRGKLPLMATGTYDYWDYYTGENGNEPTQIIQVTACYEACPSGCCVSPLYPGTSFSTGAPQPGVYYVGVYNLPIAGESIVDYSMEISVSFTSSAVEKKICTNCAEGFAGRACEEPCPGVAPVDVYSNSPSGTDSVCSGNGACSQTTSPPLCSCDDGFVGAECELSCPTKSNDDHHDEFCSGRGVCDLSDGEATCVCEPPYGGPACADACPESCGPNGRCSFADHACVCDDGYVGDVCEFECPGGGVCSSRGRCVVVHSYHGDPLRAACECDDAYHGTDCDLQCPFAGAPEALECAGNGVCTLSSEDDASAFCECFAGFRGTACDEPLNATTVDEEEEEATTSKKKKKTSTSTTKHQAGGFGRAASAGLAATAVALLVLAVAAVLLAERRKREISRYERLVREVGAASSTIITASGDYNAPTPTTTTLGDTPIPKFNEMRPVSDTVSPFHSERVDL